MVKKTDTKATTTVKKDTKPAAPAKQPAKTDAKKADNKKVDAKKVDNKKAVDTKKAVDNKKVDAKKVDAKKTDSKKVDPKAPKTVTKSGKVEKQQKVKKVKKNKFSKFANLFTVSPKNFGIGGDIQHKRDLTRFVRWPKYIRLQRQKRVLQKRLRIPPTINQFSKVADKNLAAQIIRFLVKYRPEDKRQKKERLRKSAELKKAGKKDTTKKPTTLKFGLNHVTSLIERQKASLVVIPHDVAPLEIVVWLPALCRKMDVPYAIVKSKSRLGQLVHQKKATCVALTQIRKEDKAAFNKLKEAVKINFANKYEDNRKTWGGSLLSKRSRIAAAIRKKAAATQ